MDRAPLIDREHLLRNLKVDAADLLLTIPTSAASTTTGLLH